MSSSHRLQLLARILLALLWFATFGVAIAWANKWEVYAGVDAEPITVLLFLISSAVTSVVALFRNELRAKDEQLAEEQYSMPLGLAFGYVNNFVAPLIRKLLHEAGAVASEVRLHVFIPDNLDDLEPVAVEATLAKIRAKNYQTSVLKLELEEGRPRDVLTVMRTGVSRTYFDFPNTLLTLHPVIRFKMQTQQNRASAERALGQRYIRRFKEEVGKLVAQKNLSDHVQFTDKNLAFLDSPGPAATPRNAAVPAG